MSASDDDKYRTNNDTLPSLVDFSGISLRTLAPALQVKDDEIDYLDYDQKGRGAMEKTFFNTGTAWLMGSFTGFGYGTYTGLASVPNTKLKVKVNAILNSVTRHGSRFGNGLGTLAVMYSLIEGCLEYGDVERNFDNHELVHPALAAGLTGVVYKAGAGGKVAGLAGVIGAGAVGTYYGVGKVGGMQFGSTRFMFF